MSFTIVCVFSHGKQGEGISSYKVQASENGEEEWFRVTRGSDLFWKFHDKEYKEGTDVLGIGMKEFFTRDE